MQEKDVLGEGKSRVKFWACTFFKFSLKYTSVDVNRTVGYTSLEVKKKSAGKKKMCMCNKKNVVEEK